MPTTPQYDAGVRELVRGELPQQYGARLIELGRGGGVDAGYVAHADPGMPRREDTRSVVEVL